MNAAWATKSPFRVAWLALSLLVAGCDSPGEAAATAPRRAGAGAPIRGRLSDPGHGHDRHGRRPGRDMSAASTWRSTQLMGEGVDPHLYKASPGDVSQLNAGRHDFLFRACTWKGRWATSSAAGSRNKPTFAVDRGASPKTGCWKADGRLRPARLVRRLAVERDDFDAVRRRAGQLRSAARRRLSADARPNTSERTGRSSTPSAASGSPTIPASIACWSRRTTRSAISAGPTTSRCEASRASAPRARPGSRRSTSWSTSSPSGRSRRCSSRPASSSATSKALVEGCRAQGHAVSDRRRALLRRDGQAGTPEGTYPGMVRHNVETIVKALE